MKSAKKMLKLSGYLDRMQQGETNYFSKKIIGFCFRKKISSRDV